MRIQTDGDLKGLPILMRKFTGYYANMVVREPLEVFNNRCLVRER
jgi:hypothetical protein